MYTPCSRCSTDFILNNVDAYCKNGKALHVLLWSFVSLRTLHCYCCLFHAAKLPWIKRIDMLGVRTAWIKRFHPTLTNKDTSDLVCLSSAHILWGETCPNFNNRLSLAFYKSSTPTHLQLPFFRWILCWPTSSVIVYVELQSELCPAAAAGPVDPLWTTWPAPNSTQTHWSV